MGVSRRRKKVLAILGIAAIVLASLYPFGRNYLARSREIGRLRELGVAVSRAEFEAEAPAEGANSADDFKAAIAALESSSLSESDLLVLKAYGESAGEVNVVVVGKESINAQSRVKKIISQVDPPLALLVKGAEKSRCSFESAYFDPQSGWAKPVQQILEILGARLAYNIGNRRKDAALSDFRLLGALSGQVERSSLGLLQVESFGRCGNRLASVWRSEPELLEYVSKTLEDSIKAGPDGASMQPGVYESRELLWSSDPSVPLLSKPDTFGWAYRSKLNRLMAEEKILAFWRTVSESPLPAAPLGVSPSFTAELDQDRSFSGELASQVVHAVLEKKRPMDARRTRGFYLSSIQNRMWFTTGGHVTSHAETFARAPKSP